ncbi:methyltransferase domain-containing protein [Actinomadura luteofluorescens]|uniref:methyltransferase domain-containing protein n=1 Tax=Actinomadura luteofluorescens TaxID=46163 RepID=UPI003625213F
MRGRPRTGRPPPGLPGRAHLRHRAAGVREPAAGQRPSGHGRHAGDGPREGRVPDRGHFAALADRLACSVSAADPAFVLDAGAGTGHYLGRILDRSPDAVGLALDISKHAARRAAKAHPRCGAVVADLWRPFPLRDGAADTVVNVFAPRNATEFHRVLRDDGLLFTVTPSPRHLGTLVEPLGLLSIDKDKTERMDAALSGYFKLDSRQELETETVLTHGEAITLVGMGPSAHHVPPERLRERLERLPEPLRAPLSFVLSTYRRLE